MRNQSPFSALRIISLALILIALVLTALQLVRFSRVRAFLPSGLTVAEVPVGGLDRQQAALRILEAYGTPIELSYNDSIVLLNPDVVDFQADVETMLAAADVERTEVNFWVEFWDYLWGRTEKGAEVPLRATYSELRLRTFLEELAMRYDEAPVPAMPLVGTVNFQMGRDGVALDQESSVLLIENALYSLTRRHVDLPLRRTTPSRPPFQNLQVLLKQTLQVSGFDGTAGIFLLDLQTNQEMHFAYRQGEEVPVRPDVAFTASSIIKVPIMISVFRRLPNEPDPLILTELEKMIQLSSNDAPDALMNNVIAQGRGPLLVTEDLKTLGLENTFLAGYFTPGSPLLVQIETPANKRTDVSTDPDPYSQTTPSEIGMLLEDIYQCAQTGGGALAAAFPGEITQSECQAMNRYLINNRLPSLLTGGLPEGTPIAHKHGWVSLNGVINNISDAGIIYTPGGKYILAVFLSHPQQLIWDNSSELVSQLSRAVYNYYNLPTEASQ